MAKKPKFSVQVVTVGKRHWWRVVARNGREVGWSGETYTKRAHVVAMAGQLFPSLSMSFVGK